MSSQTFITKFMSCSTSRMRHAPVVGQAPDEVGELGRLGVAEAGRRLVEQQHARLGGDGPGDGQQAALAVREVLHDAQRGRPGSGTRGSPPRPRRAAADRPGRRGRGGTSQRSRGSDAARRLSSTVESSNSSSDWNERDSPARDALGRRHAVERRRRRGATSRERAGVKPVMASIADVLPAPFGTDQPGDPCPAARSATATSTAVTPP